MAWTRTQLTKQLRQAGWVSGKGATATYCSPNGTYLHLDAYHMTKGILWKWYAEREQLPKEIDSDDRDYKRIGLNILP